MEEKFRVLRESGYDEVERKIQLLKEQGYKVKWVERGKVPFYSEENKKMMTAPGWIIVAENPKTKYKGRPHEEEDSSRWLWEEWD